MITIHRFKDFQGPFTSNSKTFKDLFHFKDFPGPGNRSICFQGLSRTFKALWPPCRRWSPGVHTASASAREWLRSYR